MAPTATRMRIDAIESAFLGEMLVLDELLDVGKDPTLLPTRFFAGQGREFVTSLVGQDGRLKSDAAIAIQKWSNSYFETIEILQAFRANFLTGAPSSPKDLRDVTEAARVAIDGLVRRLRRLT